MHRRRLARKLRDYAQTMLEDWEGNAILIALATVVGVAYLYGGH